MTDRDAQAESWVRGEMSMGESVPAAPPLEPEENYKGFRAPKFSERPVTQKEQDVIDAAREVRRTWPSANGHKMKSVGDVAFFGAIAGLLARLQALDAPTPVKPEEVGPGTRFRFVNGSVSYRLYAAWDDRLLGVPDDPLFCVVRLGLDHRIIPIPEGEEE